MEIGILIGCNCLKVLKLWEVIFGRDEDLYVVRILLGWGIIGLIVFINSVLGEEEGNLICYRIVIWEIGSFKFGNWFIIEV